MRVTLLFVLILFAKLIYAQDPVVLKYAATITAEDLKKHLSVIASDEYEGRFTGAKGLEMAAEYLVKEFKGDELTGPVENSDNPFYQEMDLERKTWKKRTLIAGEEVFENHKDILFLLGAPCNQDFEVVFGGYGIYSDNYNDYKSLDVKGKIVAILMGEPVGKDGKYLVTGTNEPSLKPDTSVSSFSESIQGKMIACIMRGAKGIILIGRNDGTKKRLENELKRMIGDVEVSLPGGKANFLESFQFMYLKNEYVPRLFGIKKKEFDKSVANLIDTAKAINGKYIQKVKIVAEQTVEPVKSSNVLAYIEGSDKKNELLVLTAHYDHEGIKGGEVYNGADDNGTGTVSLIELAEAFALAKKDGKGPRRSILFIAYTGEENGLLGSDYYAKHPVFSIDSTVASLNVDMVGRIDKEHSDSTDYIYTIGSDYLSSELHAISEKTAKTYFPELKLDYTYNDKNHPEQLYYRSDQIKLAEKGVPVIFYTSGEHDDYHSPSDDVDKIAFKAMEKRIRLVFATAWELVNRDERIKVDQ